MSPDLDPVTGCWDHNHRFIELHLYGAEEPDRRNFDRSWGDLECKATALDKGKRVAQARGCKHPNDTPF